MNRTSPVLTNVLNASCGSILVVNDGQRIPLNLTPAALQDYLANFDFPSLADVCRSQNANVYHLPLRMNDDEWSAISTIIRTSPDAAELHEFAELRDGMALPFNEIHKLPFRLYGGVGQMVNGNGPDLYTSHPFDFHADGIRELPWYYCLLNCHGGHVFKTHVNIKTKTVEIETGIIKNHYVEPEPTSDA